VVLPAAQPYRGFLLEMMERQRYPEVRPSPDSKDIFKPYDVTAWTLPLMMGVDWARVDGPLDGRLGGAPDSSWPGPPAPAGDGACLVAPAGSSASVRLVNRLLAAGVKVERALEAFEAQGRRFAPGDWLLPPAALARTGRGPAPALTALARWPGVRRATVAAPRIGLYRAWLPDMDEGWTRFVLDDYGFPYTRLDNAAMRAKGLRRRFDVVVLPSLDKDLVVDGRRKQEGQDRWFEPLPPPYDGGIGRDGAANLKAFVEEGGTLVCLSASAGLAIEELRLPVRDVLAGAKPGEVALPGVLVNLAVDPSHPLGFGLPAECAAFCSGGPVFATMPPAAGMDRAVVARFPTYDDQVVASGWAQGTDRLTGRAAVVEVTLGRGRVVLFGPRVQHRAQMVGTYKFLFNALYRGAMTP
jgi:hypothetical protein